MSTRENDGITWIVVALFALAGFMLRLHLDQKFDRITSVSGSEGIGILDSFVLDTSNDVLEKEGEDE